jgi:hypothetical protein
MSDPTGQAPALIGVVIGALASLVVTGASERSRWRREQESRGDGKRADAHAEHGNSVKGRLRRGRRRYSCFTQPRPPGRASTVRRSAPGPRSHEVLACRRPRAPSIRLIPRRSALASFHQVVLGLWPITPAWSS